MNDNRNWGEFTFEEGEEESLLLETGAMETLTAARFLELAEDRDDEGIEALFETLEEQGILLDISDLPRQGAVGQAAVRLREEMQLVEKGNLLSGLEPGDALRVYLEELEALPEAENVDELLMKLADANQREDHDSALQTELLPRCLKRSVAIAREYVGYGVLLLDLIQEGNLGLWKGLVEYSGGELAPLVDGWARQYMIRAILRQAISSGLAQKLRQAVEDYRSADERLLMELGRNPTAEEMAEYLHLTVEETEAVAKTLQNARMVDKAHVQPEPEEESPEDDLAVEDTAYYQTRERVSDLMSGLTEQETMVVNLRYGLGGKAPLSAHETAARLNMTAEEIAAVELSALTKMRGAQ